MGRSIIKLFVAGCYVFGTAACSTVVEELVSPMVASDIYNGVSKSTPGGAGNKGSYAKKVEKEKEQLKAAGKCPVCSGVGKSADGKYTCGACKGTGKYEAAK